MRNRLFLALTVPLLAASMLLTAAQVRWAPESGAGHLPLTVFYDLIADDRTARAALDRIDAGWEANQGQTTVSQLDRQVGGARAYERDKERAGTRVECFDLSGGRLRSLSRREQKHARRRFLAGCCRNEDARGVGTVRAHKPRQ